MAERKNFRTDNPSFLVYKEWEAIFREMGDQSAGRLIKAMFRYAAAGELPDFSGSLRIAFITISNQIDRDGKRWEETVLRRAAGGKQGGRPKSDRKKTKWFSEKPIGLEKEKEEEKEEVKENVNDDVEVNVEVNDEVKEPGVSPEFPTLSTLKTNFPPTFNEVAAYCAERKNGISPERFIRYYEAKNWMLGTEPMQDWKAVIRSWEINEICDPSLYDVR